MYVPIWIILNNSFYTLLRWCDSHDGAEKNPTLFFLQLPLSSLFIFLAVELNLRVFNVFIFPLELEVAKKQAETDKKAIDELVRERDILNKVSLHR